jgi:hypothetical protein
VVLVVNNLILKKSEGFEESNEKKERKLPQVVWAEVARQREGWRKTWKK